MSFEQRYRRVADAFDQEYLLLAVIIGWSIYALVETFSFDISSAGRFPRLMGSAALVGGLLLVFREYLPGPVRAFVTESTEVLQADDEFEERQEDAERRTRSDEIDPQKEISSVGRPIHDSVFTALLMIFYGALGYAVGILWVTPPFVVAYGLWFKQSRRLIALLTVLSFILAFGFMTVLGVPMDRGQFIVTGGVF